MQGVLALQPGSLCSGAQQLPVQRPAPPSLAPTMELTHLSVQVNGVEKGALTTAVTLAVVPAVGRLPQGSSLLVGEDRAYLIAPLGHLIDETYTAYFNFTQ